MTKDIPASNQGCVADAPLGPIKDPRNLAEWIDRLSEKGMPVFARTVKEISGVASDRESSAAELSRVILQDAAMTARLLRVANSPMYSLTGRTISTVSRAVVLLGFETVRSLCLSIAIIDAISSSGQKTRIALQMARSFHAAVQARAFALKRRDPSPEEVFIATLLSNIGDLAFWSIPSELAVRLDEDLQRPGCDRAQAEREVLGFELKDLSLGLTRQWNLGRLLENVLEDQGDTDPRVSNVEFARELSRTAEQGWETPETRRLLGRIAEALYMPLQDATRLVHENASQAAKTAQSLGVGYAAELIPMPISQRTTERPAAVIHDDDHKAKYVEPDPLLQLTILRELSGMLDGRHDINLLLEMVLEGVSRGIGMDRALFAMLNPERNQLRARYALGWGPQDIRDSFSFEISPLKASIFSHVLETRQPHWIRPGMDTRLKSLMTSQIAELTGNQPFFVMPVEVNGRSIGLFYADRKPSGRALDEDSYSAFRHFCQQASLALAYSRRGR